NGTTSYNAGIMTTSGWCKIIGNKIGTDITGTIALPNISGIINNGGVKGLYIGGTTVAERNIISGNSSSGLFIKDCTDTLYIKGNYIGVSATGSVLKNNSDGSNANPNFFLNDDVKVILVGGTTAAEANVISGTSVGTGLEVGQGFGFSVNAKLEIMGNIIGLNAAGTAAVPNRFGVLIGRTNYPVTFKNNIVSGNIVSGISVQGYNHQIKSNKIGTDAGGTLNLGNGGVGIELSQESQGVTIGGLVGGESNTICNNGSYGIGMDYSPGLPYPNNHHLLTRNTFYNNGDKGISQTTLMTPTPANDGYLKPVVLYASTTTIRGTAAPLAAIDLYQNHTFNNFSQGQTYVTSVTADGNGDWVYSNASISSPYNMIAVAYDPTLKNTSEFSDKYQVTIWTAGASTTDWFNAANWSNGVPSCTKSAVINTASMYPLISTGVAASVFNIDINVGTQLTIATGNSLGVCGSWLNNGVSSVGAGAVIFQGSTKQLISGSTVTTFGDLTINNTNSNGLIVNTNVIVSGTMTLSTGVVTTGTYTVNITNSSASALTTFSNSSYINGTLVRAVASNTNNYSFPVGSGITTTNYYRLDVLNNNLAGVSSLTVFVKPIVETGNNIDSRLALTESANNYNYYNIEEIAVWDVTPNTQPTSGDYGVRLFIDNIPGLTDNTFAPVKRASSSTDYIDWAYGTGTIPANGAPGRIVAGGYAERTGYTSFSQHAVGEMSDPLSVSFISFSLTRNNGNNNLEWITSNEVNANLYLVEKSMDGISFSVSDTVYSHKSNSTIQKYNSVDTDPRQPQCYYRIKEVDVNQQYSYSFVIKGSVFSVSAIEVSPNPVVGALELTFSESSTVNSTIELKIYSGAGVELIHQTTTIQNGKIILDNLSSLPSGLYNLVVTDNSEVRTVKFIKQ
ncbi:MAG TPA: T9SS type A sorting domain-containing protein, partial [Cytophagaceae bacterium]|nr:T9SS type A sorting domain-containing protein [Cytophagaceae bacterium]